jgi:hypothetical protein
VYIYTYTSWHSSVSIQRGYGLDARVRFLAEVRNFSLIHGVWIGSGAYPASYTKGAGEYLQRVKAART